MIISKAADETSLIAPPAPRRVAPWIKASANPKTLGSRGLVIVRAKRLSDLCGSKLGQVGNKVKPPGKYSGLMYLACRTITIPMMSAPSKAATRDRTLSLSRDAAATSGAGLWPELRASAGDCPGTSAGHESKGR